MTDANTWGEALDDGAAMLAGAQAAEEWRHTHAAFDAVERALLDKMKATPIGQEALVLNLHKALQAVAGVRQAIMNVIQTGQIAEQAISQAGLTRPN